MEYIKPFFIGGSVIAGSKFVSNYANPVFASLIGGMPTGILASYFLLNNKTKQSFFQGYAVSAPILALAIGFIYLMTIQFQNISVNILSTIGLFVWAVLSYTVIQYLGLGKGS